jgi:hypothetical protein
MSLLQNSVSGVFNSVSKISGSVSKGVASLTMDPEFVKEQEQQRRHRANNVSDGLVKGAMGVGRGFFDGLTGLIVRENEFILYPLRSERKPLLKRELKVIF